MFAISNHIVASLLWLSFTILSSNHSLADITTNPSPPDKASHPNQKTNTILVFGDSLSAGYGISQKLAWVHLLRQKLQQIPQQFPQRQTPSYIVVNDSLSGETTGGGLARINQSLTNHKPDIVILELGGNDGLRGYPTKHIKKNLRLIIEHSFKASAKVLLVGMHIPPNYGKHYSAQFDNVYIALSNQYDIAFLPFLLDGIATNPKLMQPDGIHPTAEGQPMILNNVLPYLTPLL